MDPINEKVGAWLLVNGHTRDELAAAVGITRPTLNARIDGAAPWKFAEVVKLADVLGVSLNALAGIPDEKGD